MDLYLNHKSVGRRTRCNETFMTCRELRLMYLSENTSVTRFTWIKILKRESGKNVIPSPLDRPICFSHFIGTQCYKICRIFELAKSEELMRKSNSYLLSLSRSLLSCIYRTWFNIKMTENSRQSERVQWLYAVWIQQWWPSHWKYS